jgi:hypothetical protein
MDKDILKKMDGYELLDTLKATAQDLDFADDFADTYSEILHRAKDTGDLSFLRMAQDLRWKQTEFLTQEWLKHYEPPTLTHGARYA